MSKIDTTGAGVSIAGEVDATAIGATLNGVLSQNFATNTEVDNKFVADQAIPLINPFATPFTWNDIASQNFVNTRNFATLDDIYPVGSVIDRNSPLVDLHTGSATDYKAFSTAPNQRWQLVSSPGSLKLFDVFYNLTGTNNRVYYTGDVVPFNGVNSGTDYDSVNSIFTASVSGQYLMTIAYNGGTDTDVELNVEKSSDGGSNWSFEQVIIRRSHNATYDNEGLNIRYGTILVNANNSDKYRIVNESNLHYIFDYGYTYHSASPSAFLKWFGFLVGQENEATYHYKRTS